MENLYLGQINLFRVAKSGDTTALGSFDFLQIMGIIKGELHILKETECMQHSASNCDTARISGWSG